MTHPGVGALTALAFVLIIGKTERFQCGKQIACYLGLVPVEESSGERRRLGHITKRTTRSRMVGIERTRTLLPPSLGISFFRTVMG